MWTNFWNWLAGLPQGSASFLGTVMGSALGLVALLLGALFNAYLNRRRDDALRDADRKALAAALHTELSTLHRALTLNAQRLKDKPPDPEHGFMVPQLTVRVFPELISKIGLLPPETLQHVMDAYLVTQQYLERMILLGGIKAHSELPGDRHVVYLDAGNASFVIDFNRTIAGDVKKGMDALAPYLR
jgi:hypothetical protein